MRHRVEALLPTLPNGVQALQAQGGGGAAARQAALEGAMRAALGFAGRWNSAQLAIAGCCRLVRAWRSTLAVCGFAPIHSSGLQAHEHSCRSDARYTNNSTSSRRPLSQDA